MKKYIFPAIAIIGLLASSSALSAQTVVSGAAGTAVDNVSVSKSGDNMRVRMDVDLSRVNIPRNKAYILTPVLENKDKSVDLPALGIYSKGRYISYERNGGSLSAKTYSEKNMPRTLRYDETVRFQGWMNGAKLYIRTDEYGCRNCKTSTATSEKLGGYKNFSYEPEFVFARPKAEVAKNRSISGQAFVDFGQGRTGIDESYHSNAAELAKIRSTIDSVRNDKDITIDRIFLKGYSSPEGKYSLNESLSRKRTEAIRQYVKDIYNLPDSKFITNFVAENWDGLREYVAGSTLPGRQEILSLIDDKLTYQDLDAKEWKLKSTYPEDYEILMEKCYPYLRRTDYKVEYTIRSYASAEEVEQVLKTRPGNLSLEEFFLAAQKYAPGSDEFNNTFLKAASVYPDDPTANLNAAVALMQEGKLDEAREYLDKAGSSGEAIYAKGLWAALEEDYAEAERFFNKAKQAGVKAAAGALQQLYDRRDILGL